MNQIRCIVLIIIYPCKHLKKKKKNETDLGKQAKEFMDKGALVPDDVIIDMVVNRLAQDDAKEKGWLLDGFPRTGAQAEAMAKKGIHPNAVIVLDVSDEALIERVTGRRLGSDGKIYHIKFNPPPEGLEVTQRDDDTAETAGKRIQTYKDNYNAIIVQYKEEIVKKIDGNGAPSDVAVEVIKALTRGE